MQELRHRVLKLCVWVLGWTIRGDEVVNSVCVCVCMCVCISVEAVQILAEDVAAPHTRNNREV